MAKKTRVLILGAAGRDFHNFNVYWKLLPDVEVVAFTATQIPNIENRVYPSSLAGPAYPRGIPIHPEQDLEKLIRDLAVDVVCFAYSDVSYEHVLHLGSRAQAAGAQYVLLGPQQTMIPSERPVIAVCAVRTGCGKSQTSRRVAGLLREMGHRVAVVRHPMPYGDLERQAVQRFATLADLESERCTIEEREEYEPHVAMGGIVFAGVDYERILRQAEAEADVVLWDGGNNDWSFYRPDLTIVVADPLRPGHERRFYPGEINVRMADLVMINKVDRAKPESVAEVKASVRDLNPRARILEGRSPVTMDQPQIVKGKRVLVVEDGPTLTHGDMEYGAGWVAAERFGAAEIVDPRPYAQGSIRRTFEKFPHLRQVLPAMGYGDAQMAELRATIEATPCDLVLVATPVDLARILKLEKPASRVRYELEEVEPGKLAGAIQETLSRRTKVAAS